MQRSGVRSYKCVGEKLKSITSDVLNGSKKLNRILITRSILSIVLCNYKVLRIKVVSQGLSLMTM